MWHDADTWQNVHHVWSLPLAPSSVRASWPLKLVRYYRVRYSDLTGWSHYGDATVINWYLAALSF